MLFDDVKTIVGSALQIGNRVQQMDATAPLLGAVPVCSRRVKRILPSGGAGESILHLSSLRGRRHGLRFSVRASVLRRDEQSPQNGGAAVPQACRRRIFRAAD